MLQGRSTELERLGHLPLQATTDGVGSTVLISGEPGIDKSALVRTLRQQAQSQGLAVSFSKADHVSQIAPGACWPPFPVWITDVDRGSRVRIPIGHGG